MPILTALTVMAAYAAARMSLRHFASPREMRSELLRAASGAADTLCRHSARPAGTTELVPRRALVAETLPNADRLIIDYDGNRTTNLDPYEVAHIIELAIHKAALHNTYSTSVAWAQRGAALPRKAFVWVNSSCLHEGPRSLSSYSHRTLRSYRTIPGAERPLGSQHNWYLGELQARGTRYRLLQGGWQERVPAR